MLKEGRIPLTAHAAGEPLLVVLLIAAPFLFGYSDDAGPTALSILLGIVVMVEAASTDWRLSLVQVIPVRVHAIIDVVLGIVLIASPFLFGFTDVAAATAFFIVLGLLMVLGFLGTEWKPDGARGPRRRTAKA